MMMKVDSANKHGILLDMVQALTDLDLVISKSYICSDGRWFMDVFHVTDQLGDKITDKNVICYIQQAISASRRGSTQLNTRISKEVRSNHASTEHTTLEMTSTDRPGLLSEISAVLAELKCRVSSAVAWTHNTRAACIMHVQDDSNPGSIMDPHRADQVQAQLVTVVDAHHTNHQRWSLRLTGPTAGQTHTERRLHQLMMADKDYEETTYGPKGYETVVTIENCREKSYSVLNITSRDRPKLLFDTVCTLTDLQYVVFHATVSSKGRVAFQEYYIRKKDGHTLTSEIQRQAITQCIIAAVERRVSHGLRLDIRSRNRSRLLSDVTRVLRENGLSIARAEIGTHGERVVGSFHVTDARGNDVDGGMVEAVKKEIEKLGGMVLVASESSSNWLANGPSSNNENEEERPARLSLGTLLWSQLERLSSKFQMPNSQPWKRNKSSEFVL
ncbi:hypothetical protein OSB04_000097 [Centaurea solstitialis]|uniref:ACT domain-containing protein ACR n=1 Tax=Centaurea solstitialis TaxID=347529 RepID=A0AA38TYY1_9ASTR|nr:hypothetical protein OSB04_000097 [Centaurea solstitialis]